MLRAINEVGVNEAVTQGIGLKSIQTYVLDVGHAKMKDVR